MRRLTWLKAIGFVGIVAACAAMAVAADDNGKEDDDQEKERQVTIDQVPAKVKATILKAAKDNKIEELEEVTLTVYEAEWTVGDKETEVAVNAQGELISKSVEPADKEEDDDAPAAKAEKPAGAPAAKAKANDDEDEADDKEEADDEDEAEEKEIALEETPDAVKAALLKLAGDNKIAEVEMTQKKFYEAEWTQDGQEREILVGANGKIAKRGGEKGDKDEVDDKEDDGDAAPAAKRPERREGRRAQRRAEKTEN